ncbi:MAG: DUF4382 domain-containing protein [Steroidobacterales bacterium]
MHTQHQAISPWPGLMRRARAALLCGTAAALAACGSGGGSMGSTVMGSSSAQACSGSCGGAVVTLTDDAGAFQTYLVNVDSLQLTRSDGTVVETMPTAARVDFTQLVNLSELVSSAQLPGGRYVSASLTLDYSSAQIVLAGGSTLVPAGDIYLGTSTTSVGAGNTMLTVTLALDTNHPLVITPGTVQNLALDFNLNASNVIATTNNVTTVTINPVLTGSLVPDQTKQIRVRGPLVSVGTASSDGSGSFVLHVRPFTDDNGDDGQFTVDTTATTAFAINGATTTGGAGLAALSAALASAGSSELLVAAYGSLDLSTMVFTATSVMAGASVIGFRHDGIEGTVVAVTAGSVPDTHVLTVFGGVRVHADDWHMDFTPRVSVTVGANTTVAELGQGGAFTYNSISVGQRAQFAGAFGQDSTGNATLDATAGAANLLPTRIDGTVSAAPSGGVVTLSLQSINGSPAAATPAATAPIFNFAGTGTTSANDARAAAYTVGVPSGLSTAGLAQSTPVEFIGFVTPFGAAAGTSPPDFSAITLVNYANTNANLTLNWAQPGDTTLTDFAVSASALAIDQNALSASVDDLLRVGFENLSLSGLTGGLHIVPDSAPSGPVFYAIASVRSWKIDTYSTWSDFSMALTSAFAGGGDVGGSVAVLQINARGPYSAQAGTLSADQMIVILGD